MSNRTLVAKLSALRTSHEEQIKVLLDKELSYSQAARTLVALFGGSGETLRRVNSDGRVINHRFLELRRRTIAYDWWNFSGHVSKSLFGNLPACRCPVQEARVHPLKFPGISPHVSLDWTPTREVLETFSRVQLKAWGDYWATNGELNV